MPLFLQPLIKYFDFQGRAHRAEYWQFIGFQFVVSLVLTVLGLQVINALWSLAVFIPSIAVAVRRYHDINRTGWWYLFPMAVITVAFTILITVSAGSLPSLASAGHLSSNSANSASELLRTLGGPFLLCLALCLVSFVVPIVFHLMPGTDGSNRFGDDPKGGTGAYVRVFDGPDSGDISPVSDNTPYTPVFDFSPNGKTQQRANPETPTIEAKPRLPEIPAATRASAPPPRPQSNALPGVTPKASFGKRGL